MRQFPSRIPGAVMAEIFFDLHPEMICGTGSAPGSMPGKGATQSTFSCEFPPRYSQKSALTGSHYLTPKSSLNELSEVKQNRWFLTRI
jgi:hypothetical protein